MKSLIKIQNNCEELSQDTTGKVNILSKAGKKKDKKIISFAVVKEL